MREHGIRARHKRRFKATTGSGHSVPLAPKLVAHNLSAETLNRVWTGDIPRIRTGEGWLDPALVPDLFNREVVGWASEPRMMAELVSDALAMARRRSDRPRDRGSPYASLAMAAKLTRYAMTAAMSPQGQRLGRRPHRRFFDSSKSERIHGTTCATRRPTCSVSRCDRD